MFFSVRKDYLLFFPNFCYFEKQPVFSPNFYSLRVNKRDGILQGLLTQGLQNNVLLKHRKILSEEKLSCNQLLCHPVLYVCQQLCKWLVLIIK